MHAKLRRKLAAAIPAGVERLAVTDREQWLRWREKSVTASVAGALLGEHEYSSRFQLWALKSGRTTADSSETPAMRRGRLLEPVAVQCLREDLAPAGWIVDPCGFFYNHAGDRMGATPDTVAWAPGRPGFGTIQIKTVAAAAYRAKWVREDRSVEPPLWITIQAIQEAKMIGASWACVAPMVIHDGGDIELPVIDVPIHEGIWGRLKAEAAAFWRSVDEGVAPPPDYAKDGDLIESLWSPHLTEVDLSGDNLLPALLDEREAITARGGEIEKRKKAIKAEILFKLDAAAQGEGEPLPEDATVSATLADGRRVVASLRKRAGFTTGDTSWRQVDVRKAKGEAA